MSGQTASLWAMAAVLALINPDERGAFYALVVIAVFATMCDIAEAIVDWYHRRELGRLADEVKATAAYRRSRERRRG